MRLVIVAALLAVILNYLARATTAALDVYDRLNSAYTAADRLTTASDAAGLNQGLDLLKTSLNEGTK